MDLKMLAARAVVNKMDAAVEARWMVHAQRHMSYAPASWVMRQKALMYERELEKLGRLPAEVEDLLDMVE
jgi:hypothetical protein